MLEIKHMTCFYELLRITQQNVFLKRPLQNIHWIVQNITSDKIVKRSETSAQNRKSLRKSGIILQVKILTMWHSYINDEEL